MSSIWQAPGGWSKCVLRPYCSPAKAGVQSGFGLEGGSRWEQQTTEKAGYVYILASSRNGTLYIGVTSDLAKRIHEHRIGAVPGFTRKYGCKILVWYQAFDDLDAARHRELQMKEWKRAWKLRLIEELNPGWVDLYDTLF